MDGGEGYTTIWIYLTLSNYTLKNNKDGKFYVYFTTVRNKNQII